MGKLNREEAQSIEDYKASHQKCIEEENKIGSAGEELRKFLMCLQTEESDLFPPEKDEDAGRSGNSATAVAPPPEDEEEEEEPEPEKDEATLPQTHWKGGVEDRNEPTEEEEEEEEEEGKAPPPTRKQRGGGEEKKKRKGGGGGGGGGAQMQPNSKKRVVLGDFGFGRGRA